jgi:hypothetical protein
MIKKVILSVFCVVFTFASAVVGYCASNSCTLGATLTGTPTITVTQIQDLELELITKRGLSGSAYLVNYGSLRDDYVNEDCSRIQLGIFKVESVPGVDWSVDVSDLVLHTDNGGELTVDLRIALGDSVSDDDHFAPDPNQDIKYSFISAHSLALPDGQNVGYFLVRPYSVYIDQIDKVGDVSGTFTVTVNLD